VGLKRCRTHLARLEHSLVGWSVGGLERRGGVLPFRLRTSVLLLATENAAARIHLSQGLSEQVAVQKKLRDADHEVERMALQHLLGERRQRAVAWVELRRYAGLDCGSSKERVSRLHRRSSVTSGGRTLLERPIELHDYLERRQRALELQIIYLGHHLEDLVLSTQSRRESARYRGEDLQVGPTDLVDED
jgi:hypothetical protein